ncbi:pirin family protein [Chitinophaga sp.]|uniref:pirin family protein n=1 Tax=Chitinophaga sp. TaxID=1869181 RepID=UPI0031E189D8
MIPQSKGKMYLSDERGYNEMPWFRTYNTFNFGRYFNEHKQPFGALYVLNEDVLAGGKGFRMEVETPSDIILLPIVGTITFSTDGGHRGLLEAGQVQVLHLTPGHAFEVRNPYENDLVKFLQLWIKTPVATSATLTTFDLSHKDQLNTLVSNDTYTLSIGKFNGRAEGVYQLKDKQKGVFVFNIEGAFEVQYRLLHNGDGLGLWEVEEVEMEALSSDAIILLLEIAM